MKIHEYQAKDLLRAAGLPVPEGTVATTVDATVAAADSFGYPVAVKAQVHAGGRGKAGGIRIAKSSAEAIKAATAILAMTLQTAQTGAGGITVSKVLVELCNRP